MNSNFWRKSVGLEPGDNWKREWAAGILSYFASVYIVMVNAAILHDAGMPLRAGMVATLLTAVTGCLLMAFGGKTPIIVVPGMGINAFFTYTLVHSMKLDWREALAVVGLTGVLFAVVAFTSLYRILSEAIPHNLQHAITVGIGLFLTFIGLQKSGIVIAHRTTFVAIGHFSDPAVITSCVTLILALVLFIRGTRGGLLISMLAGTGLAYLLGAAHKPETTESGHVFTGYGDVFAVMDWSGVISLVFWIAVFLLLLIVVFENIGLISSQALMAGRPERFKSSLRALSVANIAAGLFGSSPVVAAAESTAGIAAGGKSGLTSLVTGLLFGATFLFIPLLAYVPDSAIAPILIVIGGLMVQSVREMDLSDMTELFPAFLVMVMIPFTYSIVDGMAFGFITYPIVKLAMGKGKDVPPALYGIAGLFVANFVLHAFMG
ncbi:MULTISPECIES: NCS2 family permease [unclassified Paenibacillus]|uniref:NCS2 family permease n=1 Tax=unclassified Paenibacillus TaxID=185978 RepID=UPI0024062008|nr:MULTISPECIES: NCS2 family permease [unclassified Paenibacillus]MDF9843944.1 AGZA family xanthine/uracil permease-like MFS transporter [Paenibacillus sp. PastF-2]MDF9850549.1 AGZA family xanthine/uracil permease-like MFS transporter [Paenibacillus sp. PastM-2]MDF9856275.1 AGZA family xanthine/uracil permease-like MFS transporter [Paenibacillus sp. PastF-1]MDH6481496.1 AGZA family xanthine/uracil permease-like MFS transporter [Paenibacillus sp. PastH-2]MDH6509810.1 AGZA family xanthine/uracil